MTYIGNCQCSEGRADTQVRPYGTSLPPLSGGQGLLPALCSGERGSAVPLRRGIEGVGFPRRGTGTQKEPGEIVNE